jgi:hypothetical protein
MTDNEKRVKLKEIGRRMQAANGNGRLLQKLQAELDKVLDIESSPESDDELEEAWERENHGSGTIEP